MGDENKTFLEKAAGFVPVAGQIFNAINQGAMNRKTRKWNEKMYTIQRQDALSDWERQNAYNSPEAQMERLKKAGLNPNLVYGNGVEGNASGQVRSSDTGNWNPHAASVDMPSAFLGMYDMQVKQAQVDNMEVQREVMQNEAKLKLAQTIATLIGADASEFNLGIDKELRDTTVQGRKVAVQKMIAELFKTEVDTKVMLDANERAIVAQNVSIVKAAEEILTLRKGRAKTDAEIREIEARIKNINEDTALKKFDRVLQDAGISRNSPWWFKLVSDIMAGGKTKPEQLQSGMNIFKTLFPGLF